MPTKCLNSFSRFDDRVNSINEDALYSLGNGNCKMYDSYQDRQMRNIHLNVIRMDLSAKISKLTD